MNKYIFQSVPHSKKSFTTFHIKWNYNDEKQLNEAIPVEVKSSE